MSLNAILKAAQKLGMPVVITDRAGASAQVVLPFEDFMALVNSAPHHKRGIASGALDDFQVEFEDEDPEGLDAGDWDGVLAHDTGKESAGDAFDFTIEAPSASSVDPVTEPITGFNAMGEPGDGSMDEKFYLEPLDDEEGLNKA